MNKPINFIRLLAKMNIILLINILRKNLANISFWLSKTAKKFDEKVIFLIKAIDIIKASFIFQVKLCTRSIPKIDRDYKNTKMSIIKLKKIRKKKGKKDSWEDFKLVQTKKSRVIAKVIKKYAMTLEQMYVTLRKNYKKPLNQVKIKPKGSHCFPASKILQEG